MHFQAELLYDVSRRRRLSGPLCATFCTGSYVALEEPGRRRREMEPLAQMTCVACRPGEPTVSEEDSREYLKQIPAWRIVEQGGIPRLMRVFTFPDFASALDFTNRVGALAEQEGHHPALLTEWGKVAVSWWTHAIGGLHRNDFILAARTDTLYTAHS
jgi:4a-hydroxytetrahydrobiopterin dehydratase